MSEHDRASADMRARVGFWLFMVFAVADYSAAWFFIGAYAAGWR